jgi:hypothetical protein
VTSLEDQVRTLAERSVDAAEQREVDLGSAAYVASQEIGRHSRLLAAAAALVIVVAGVVVAVGVAGDDAPSRRPVVAPTVPLAPLRARLVLPSTRLRAGEQMSGEVVVDNDTGEPIEVTGCNQFYVVALSNDSYTQSFGHNDCLEHFTIPAGTSHWPVLVLGTLTSCVDEPGAEPSCLPGGGLPLLPKGTYRAEVVVDGEHDRPIPIPDPVTITVE